MKLVTVVTLYDGKMADHFVGVIAGEVDLAAAEALCKAYDAVLEEPEDDDNWEGRQLFFARVEMADTPLELGSLLNIDGEYPTVFRKPA